MTTHGYSLHSCDTARVTDEPDLVLLARVIDRGSFARAAADLDVPPSTLSRRIAALEQRLGVRALERTTRHLRATEVGAMLAEHGRRVRAELDEAERGVADHRQTPRGVLRLAMSSAGGDLVAPAIAEMLARYPDVRIEIITAEEPLEVEDFDAALCIDVGQSARTRGVVKLGVISPVLAASRRYLDRAPPLRHPRDLENPAHSIVGLQRRSSWKFTNGSGTVVTVNRAAPRTLVNAKVMVAQLVAAGAGLGLVPRSQIGTELTVLEPGGYRPMGGPFFLVTPSAGTAPPKVRAFADAARAYVATRPDLFV